MSTRPIINLRGTSGSGKSTIVRQVAECYPEHQKYYVKGRKRPYFTLYRGSPELHDLAIVGHYEADCGGCDTILDQTEIFYLVRRLFREGYAVLFEGLLISGEYNRTLALHTDGLPLKILALDLSLEECIASIELRRENKWKRRCEKIDAENEERQEKALAKGRQPPKLKPRPFPPKPLKPDNTRDKWKVVKAVGKKLEAGGVWFEWANRARAYERVLEELKR